MATTDSGQRAERVKSAAQMYVYGYPLVYCLREVAGFAEGHSSLPLSAPWNEFGYARELLGPETTFVSPNNDTLYVLAALDLRPGPLVLHVPDTADRYYVLQFVDAWTNNFAYIGRRATGTGERRFLLAGPGDTTEAPEGTELVRAPTNVVMIAGRVQINGVADAPAVHAIQDQFTLTPLDANSTPASGIPAPDPGVPEELRWWESFRVELAAFPPPAGDAPLLAIAETLGLTASESPYIDADSELGGSTTAPAPTRPAPRPRAPGCSATTATRPTTRSSTSTPTASNSTAPTATSCASTRCPRSTRSGR